MRLLVVAILLLSLGLDACGSKSTAQNPQSTPPLTGTLAIATYEPTGGPGMTALIVGTLRGTVNSDQTACFRIAEDPHQTPMVWPAGYSGSTDPLRVIDGLGKTVAVDGHHVRLGGGTSDFATGRPVRGCGEAKQVLIVE